MIKDTELLKCFHCGQTYCSDKYHEKEKMICRGCGMETVPLVVEKVNRREAKEFSVVLGFFTIVALLGALGGIMMVHGWNFWVTFVMIGGIIFIIGKIFMGKYKIREIGEYVSGEISAEDRGIPHAQVFDQLVVDAIHELPQNLKDRLSSVSVMVEDMPSSSVIDKLGLMKNSVLLGLFQGVPLNKKSVWQSGALPERITIFQKNIEMLCHSDEEIKQRIKGVVRHEVAHFVGFTEEEIRKLGY